MKKGYLILTTTVFICLSMVFTLSGCSSIKPNSPSNICIVGSCLMWNSSSDSATYTVYEGDTEIGTTEATSYKLPDICSSNTEYSIMAKGWFKSGRSEKIIRYKNTNFTSSEQQDVNISSISALDIPATTLKVSLTGMGNGISIVVGARTTPLIIELNNASIVGKNDLHAVTMASSNLASSGTQTTLVINSIGSANSIIAGAITNVPNKASAGKNGATGAAGCNGVLANTVIVCGIAPITISGGVGGVGGPGGDSQGASVTGDGGTGGVGGSAIQCNNLFVAMEETASLTLHEGKGGSGGTQGSNNSVMSGLWNNMLGTDGHVGSTGKAGAKVQGTVKVISGAYTG